MISGQNPIPTRQSFGNVYYCDGCVDPNASAEEGDSELEGEDTFVSGRNIDTEIRTDVGDEVIDQAGDTVSVNGESHSDGSSSASGSAQEASAQAPQRRLRQRRYRRQLQTTQKELRRKKSTTSALDSLAETAESVIQETTEEERRSSVWKIPRQRLRRRKLRRRKHRTTAAPSAQAETASARQQHLLLKAAEETTVKVIRVSRQRRFGRCNAPIILVHAAAEDCSTCGDIQHPEPESERAGNRCRQLIPVF